MKTPSMAYLICTNPRSGSWLLAEGLRASGVAGRPEEYANDLLRPLYLRDFDLTPPVAPEVLLDRMIEAGTTDNGVFGAKVHRMQWQAFLSLLRAAVGDPDADELDAITTVFPDLVLVHHDRQDRTGQALSWYRALATDNWWHVDGVRDIRAEADLALDAARVTLLEERLEHADAAWRDLFRRACLPVITSTYEDLVADYPAALRRLLGELGISARTQVPPPRLVRQADETTKQWRADYVRSRSAGDLNAAPANAMGVVTAQVNAEPNRRGMDGAEVDAPEVSIVVVTHNEGDNLPRTVAGLRATTGPDTQIVVVDDQSTDGSLEAMQAAHPDVEVVRPQARLGVSGARNAGAAHARGRVLVFSDAHVDPAPGWLPPLLEALADESVGEVAPVVRDRSEHSVAGYGFTWPDLSMRVAWLRQAPGAPPEVPFICGCFLALRRATFERVGGFDDGLIRWGSEDAELSLRVWRHGLRCLVVPDSSVAHLFRPVFGYQVDWEHTLHNMIRTAALHLPADVLASVIERWRDHPAWPQALARLDLPGLHALRQRWAGAPHDGQWVLDRFAIPVTAVTA